MEKLSPLMQAIHSCSIQDVELCLAQTCPNSSRLKETDRYARTALIVAAMCGHGDCVRLLLPVSDVLAQNPLGHSGHSALMLAARYGHVGCTRLLLPGSDPLAVQQEGRSALMLAVHWGA